MVALLIIYVVSIILSLYIYKIGVNMQFTDFIYHNEDLYGDRDVLREPGEFYFKAENNFRIIGYCIVALIPFVNTILLVINVICMISWSKKLSIGDKLKWFKNDSLRRFIRK